MVSDISLYRPPVQVKKKNSRGTPKNNKNSWRAYRESALRKSRPCYCSHSGIMIMINHDLYGYYYWALLQFLVDLGGIPEYHHVVNL